MLVKYKHEVQEKQSVIDELNSQRQEGYEPSKVNSLLSKYKQETELFKANQKEQVDRLLEMLSGERQKNLNLECEVGRLNGVVMQCE